MRQDFITPDLLNNILITAYQKNLFLISALTLISFSFFLFGFSSFIYLYHVYLSLGSQTR